MEKNIEIILYYYLIDMELSKKQERSDSLNEEMYVTKRNGNREIVSFDKILNRIKKIGQEANMKLNYTTLVMKVIDQLYDGISTTKIDELSAEQCASMASIHPDYSILAGSIIISNHHRNTSGSFVVVMTQLYQYRDKQGKHSPLLADDVFNVIQKYADVLENICDYKRDYLIDYFGFKTLERAYLMKINKKIVERIQHMWLRVSIGIHKDNLDRIKETYDLMSQKYFTHATPTLFNSGTPRPQNSSCFLIAMESDSIDGIYNTLKDCASISKWAGGIGMHIHNIRASGSHIRGTNGSSNGIVPMLKVFNHTAKYVDQCLDPETIVYTKRGALPIKNIVIGDEVITDDGYFYEIGKVLDNEYFGDMYELDIKHTLTPLKLTDMHPLWTIKNDTFYQTNFNIVENMLDRNLIIPEFIEVKNIDKNDFIGFPIPRYEKDISHFTEEDCRFYGILLGDGYLNNKNNLCYVALNKETKANTILFVEEYLRKLNIHITYTEKDDKYLRLSWTRTSIFKFTYEMCYDYNKEKYVMPNMLHISKPKILQIIKGILETDGKVKDNQIVLEITSKNIIESVRYMLLRLGILTSGSVRNRIGENHITKYGKYIECKKISYILIIPKKPVICNLFPEKELKHSTKFTFFEYDNYLFSIVNNNTLISDYSGRVIDIEVDDDDHHNFLTHNGLVKNGGGKRNGSFAIYLEPWHADIEVFLQMRKNHGDEELKARDLFYALWIPDLFMERIKTDGQWTLMCPDECPGLSDVYGDEFKKLYTKYEEEGKGKNTMKARDLWFQVLDAQMETGTPYLVYKDAANKKSNQQNVGTIKSSNLCVAPETMILTDNGYFRIDKLEGQNINVWNGEEFSETVVYKTGEDQELIEVHISDGNILNCTKYHKFYIDNGNGQTIIEAKNLSIGDTIINYKFPLIKTDNDNYHLSFEDKIQSYTHGVLSSSVGYYDFDYERFRTNGSNSIPMLLIPDFKENCIKYLKYFRIIKEQDSIKNISYSLLYLDSNIGDKFYVPINNCLEYKLEWFAGICDMDGKIFENNFYIEYINNHFAIEIQKLLNTCSIDSSLIKYEGSKYISISLYNIKKLIDLGLNLRCENIYNEIINYTKQNREQIIQKKTVINTAHKNRRSNTYCFTESKRGMGIFNGILTGQCSEIIQYSDANETSVCNLLSLALPSYIDMNNETPIFNYEKLHEVTKIATYNLNQIIDVNYYPTEKTRVSNMRHRPIGIGIQGLADVFMLMNIPFTSEEAKKMNRLIFETIYHAAVEQSCEMAADFGPYESFKGSPASKGQLQFDLWGVNPTLDGEQPRYDWDKLKRDIMEVGMRNSLLLAPMPTASTSQILGNNECFEPITSNIYNRRTIAGEFILANKYLMKDLIKLDLWNEKVKNNIIANNGSIQHIDIIPADIKEKYKTVWEIPMRVLIDMAADRGAFICQSQSLNLWLEDPNYSTLTSMHFYAWSKGLKTGIYYLRRRGRHQAQQFTIEPEKKDLAGQLYEEEEVCEMCSA